MTGNGWLSSILYLAQHEFKMTSEEAIWKEPLAQLMLLLRQHIYINDKKSSGIDLWTQEAIDSGEVDRQLKQKRLGNINTNI